MAANWADDFQAYPDTASMLAGLYANVGLHLSVDLTGGGPGRPKCLRWNHTTHPANGINGDYGFRRVFGSAQQTQGVALRLYVDQLPSVEVPGGAYCAPIAFLNASGVTQVTIMLGTDGALVAYRGGVSSGFGDAGAYTLLQRSDPCIQASAYNHIEAKCVCSNSGALEVRVNGVTVLNFSGDTDYTGGGETSQVLCFQSDDTSIQIMRVIDLHSWNDQAGEGPTDFAGNVGCLPRAPIADTADAGMTPSTGSTAYNLLADGDDATYVSAATTGLKTGVTCAALDAGTSGILYQQAMLRALKTDASDCDLTPSFISSGDETATPALPLTTGNIWRLGIVASDPHTAAPWAVAAANASEVAVERTT